MEEKVRVKRPHRLNMEDRKRIDFTGITDVVSFDPVKVVLESDYGHITIKGEGLHVNRLSVEKGELDLDGLFRSRKMDWVSHYCQKIVSSC